MLVPIKDILTNFITELLAQEDERARIIQEQHPNRITIPPHMLLNKEPKMYKNKARVIPLQNKEAC